MNEYSVESFISFCDDMMIVEEGLFDRFKKKEQYTPKKNEYAPYNGDIRFIPKPLQNFYKKKNPVDAYVTIRGFKTYEDSEIYLIPAERLIEEQKNYWFNDGSFVFASCNGDPIFYNDGKIYTCPHGCGKLGKSSYELIASNFTSFISMLKE